MDVIFSTETTTENAAESAEETPEFPLPVVDEPVVDNFPDELLECDNWVVWRYEWKKNNRGEWKVTKVPYNARSGYGADTTKSASWVTFREALKKYLTSRGKKKEYHGVGFVFSENDPYTGIDFDGCIDEEGEIAPWASKWIERLDGYTELSPSGTGLHVLVKAESAHSGKKGSVE